MWPVTQMTCPTPAVSEMMTPQALEAGPSPSHRHPAIVQAHFLISGAPVQSMLTLFAGGARPAALWGRAGSLRAESAGDGLRCGLADLATCLAAGHLHRLFLTFELSLDEFEKRGELAIFVTIGLLASGSCPKESPRGWYFAFQDREQHLPYV